MPLPPWPELATFMALVLIVCTYVMAASGHFPKAGRSSRIASTTGTIILWGTIVLVALAGVFALFFAYMTIPWYAAVIGGGLMMLIAPFTLQPFPDRFVDGQTVLVALALMATAVSFGAWQAVV